MIRPSECPHARTTSWFVDVDLLWLRPRSTPPSASGHVFATMHANQVHWGNRHKAHFWKCNFVARPDCEEWLGQPFAFPRKSPVLASVLKAVDDVLAKDNMAKTPYLYFMNVVKKSLQDEVWHLTVKFPR
jgi:hypothetical protein